MSDNVSREAVEWVSVNDRLPPFGATRLCRFTCPMMSMSSRVVGACLLTGNDFLSEWRFGDWAVAVSEWCDFVLPSASPPGSERQTELTLAAELLEDLDLHWQFDNGQVHTHAWHTKQDFLEKWQARLGQEINELDCESHAESVPQDPMVLARVRQILGNRGFKGYEKYRTKPPRW